MESEPRGIAEIRQRLHELLLMYDKMLRKHGSDAFRASELLKESMAYAEKAGVLKRYE